MCSYLQDRDEHTYVLSLRCEVLRYDGRRILGHETSGGAGKFRLIVPRYYTDGRSSLANLIGKPAM